MTIQEAREIAIDVGLGFGPNYSSTVLGTAYVKLEGTGSSGVAFRGIIIDYLDERGE